jgi:topoisomerase IV subunit B
LIEFEPDPEIFKEFEFKPEHIERRLRHYSYLNTGLKLMFNGKTFQSRLGLMDLVMEELSRRQRAVVFAAALHQQDAGVLFHPQQQPLRRDLLLVRQRPVHQRRRHAPERLSRGLLKAVNEHANAKFDGDDVREAMVGAVAIRLQDPVFESQTKNKLGQHGDPDRAGQPGARGVAALLPAQQADRETILAKVEDTQQLRKELQEVKKLARERAKAITLRIPQLKDCKNHFDKAGTRARARWSSSPKASPPPARSRELPRREHAGRVRAQGQAAQRLGSQARRDVQERRDVQPHAGAQRRGQHRGLALREGHPRHRRGRGRLHIRNLMITYFFRFFEQLVHDGHVHVLETPLFRVRNKERTIYCYSEAERDAAVKALGGKPEITRFKGLGEISPAEFKQFIGKDMRLSRVEYAPRPESARSCRSTWAGTRRSGRITSWTSWWCRWRSDPE